MNERRPCPADAPSDESPNVSVTNTRTGLLTPSSSIPGPPSTDRSPSIRIDPPSIRAAARSTHAARPSPDAPNRPATNAPSSSDTTISSYSNSSATISISSARRPSEIASANARSAARISVTVDSGNV